MSEEKEEKSTGFKVVDKRRFSSEGEERNVPDSSAAQDSVKSADASRHHSEGQPNGSEEEITFASFLMSLATQALMQLGDVPPPPGVDMPKDVAAAKQTIEIISLLEKKTKGNLDKDEEYMVSEILHNLRMRFIQSAKK